MLQQLPDSLSAWREWPQFILCRPDKRPCDSTGALIDPHDSANWMSSDMAIEAARTFDLHVGFVFTENDPFWFLDIDKQLDTPVAQQMLEVFNGAAYELSTSGNGMHLFGCGTAPEHGKKNASYGMEFYTEGRYVLLTGTDARGDVWLDWSAKLQWLVEAYFPPTSTGLNGEWRDHPVSEWSGPTDDAVLIGKMMSQSGGAAAVFGNKATIADLWNRNETALARAYPSISGSAAYDESSADAALASHLAFWTGKDHARIERLMRQSALAREKWDRHGSYMHRTVTNAVSGCNAVYGTPRPEPVQAAAPALNPEITTGVQFLSPQQQVEYFRNCIYVARNHGVLVPNGAILKPEQFKAQYGGYTFSLDATNERTTKNAWEALIDNQAVRFPRVDGVCFRPREKPYALIEEEGLKLVNTYVPINVPRQQGDPGPFLDLVDRLLPNQGDRDILLAYMASVVQDIGFKFQWCPIIQGAEGNGKTTIARIVERAVGQRYTHHVNTSDLGNNGLKFTGWVEQNCFASFEEIFVSDRRELTEPLKPLVTNDRFEIQHKGVNQYTGDNFVNLMMFSNHKDCMKITYDMRRYCMLFTGQQSEADLVRDGMAKDYFPRLYDWLRNQGGFAIMAEFLHTYAIPYELGPAKGCHRAPRSSSFMDAISTSLGTVEQNILEVVDAGRVGFRGGYISSKCLDDLLKELRLESRISPQKRKSIIESLGYRLHPALRDGRTTSIVAAEGLKPRLYTRNEQEATDPAEAKHAYELAQGYITT